MFQASISGLSHRPTASFLSPPRKIFVSVPGAFSSGPSAHNQVYAGPLFGDDDDEEPDAILDLPIADASAELLRLTRSSTAKLGYVREVAYDAAQPLQIAELDGMVGPWDARIPVTTDFPELMDILKEQPPNVIDMTKSLIPKVCKQIHLVAKPGTRIDHLYNSFGFKFQLRGQQDAGIVGLALCLSRKACGLSCTRSPEPMMDELHTLSCNCTHMTVEVCFLTRFAWCADLRVVPQRAATVL